MTSLLHQENKAAGSCNSANRKTRKKFGATSPPYIDYLKQILRRYPDGGQILKELIQNADDAEAKEVVFLFDERSYGTSTLFLKDLKSFQGPALLVYNDSVFSEEDWQGIQNTGTSTKRNDPNKVGQFGLGFNTIYHITDLPAIFSGKYVGFLDPQEMLFGEEEGGYIWSLDDPEDRKTLELSKDQMRPFKYAMETMGTVSWSNVLKEHYFKGTLFRFPLRGEPSEISENLYDKDKIFDLFGSFRGDAEITLLFLRNVASITIKHLDPEGNVEEVLRAVASQPEYIPCFNHNLNVENQEFFSRVKTSTCVRAVSQRDKAGESQDHWLITSCTANAGEWTGLDELAEKLSYVPYVGLAFPLSRAETAEAGEDKLGFEGRLCFFLPLPDNESNRTGLPVHVNAFFGLSDNRRHIKWVETDQRYDEAAKWNELLMQTVLPFAYCRIILDGMTLAQTSALRPASVYHLWPDYERMNRRDRWLRIVTETVGRLLEFNILFLAASEDKWIRADKAIFLHCHDQPEMQQAIEAVLVEEAHPLVRVPRHVFKAIESACAGQGLNTVSPSSLRNILQHCDLDAVPYDRKLLFLEFALRDGRYDELSNLQLLPLSNGSFVKFLVSTGDEPVFTESDVFPRILLPNLERFLPEDLNATTLSHLQQIASDHVFANVTCLDAELVKQYIRRVLPENWTQNSGRVTWDLMDSHQPPWAWLVEFWGFLHRNCSTLEDFEGLPLIPLTPLARSQSCVQLASLSKRSTLIFEGQNGCQLPDVVVRIIARVGGSVIQSGGSESYLKHQQLTEYVLQPNPGGVLKVFMNLGCDQVAKEVGTMSYEERRSLRGFLAEASGFDTDERNVLFKLPVFQPMPSLKSSSRGLVAAASHEAMSNDVFPEFPDDVVLPETVLRCVDEKDRKLLLMRGRLLTAADVALLLCKGVESQRYEPEQTERAMLWVLRYSEVLFKQKPELLHKCRALRFLASKDKMVQACALFDPNNAAFRDLFQPEFQHLFPPPVFCQDEKVLQTLQRLGLKSKEENICPDDVLKVAKSIDRQQSQPGDLSDTCKRAEALIAICNQTSVLANCTSQVIEQLCSLQWVPGFTKPSAGNVEAKVDFHRPEHLWDSKYTNIVGSGMLLTDRFIEKASRILGLTSLPPAEKVVENLLLIVQQADTVDCPNYNFMGDLHTIYEYMQSNLSQFKGLLLAVEMPWVWDGAGFSSPRSIVFCYPEGLDLSCYMKRVPQEISQYRELLVECGVKTGFTGEEIILILHHMKSSLDKLNGGYGSSQELKAAISVLDWMRRRNVSPGDDLPVPVWKGNQGGFCLKPLSNAVLCDMNREALDDVNRDGENFHVVHEEISLATIEWLNVPALSTRVLNPELFGIEQYGQVEPLILRIRNILKEYDQEHDLFKELIQNAEDAGATVCSFLVDMRQSKDSPETLIDPGMASCHGPALWSYNNECFTEADFQNITKVGTGAKAKQVEKIGKFGLGFNSVYHITDVPSILSGKYLLVFDPNVTHLKKHILSANNPGIKLNLYEHRRLIQRFHGQFNPYNGIFGCNFKIAAGENFYYEGTLIKLPFRTPEEASVSEICNKYYNQKHIMSLVDSFRQTSRDLIVFLRNVKKVSLKFISEHSDRENQVIPIFKMERQVLSIVEVADGFPIKKMQENAVSALEGTNKFNRKIKNFSTSTIIQFTEETIDNPSQMKYWLVHSCFGMSKALHFACNAYFALPLGSVAVPLRKRKETGHWIPDTESPVGQVFCFLPLSVQCGLPVHVNGTFAVTSNRKNLWSTGSKGEWNQALLEDAVSAAYVTCVVLMQQMAQKGEVENYDYYTYWPNLKKVDNQFRVVLEKFYKTVAHGISGVSIKAFSNGKDWGPIGDSRFLDSVVLTNRRVGEAAVREFSRYLPKPLLAVHLPDWVRKGFAASGCESIVDQNTYTWESFYREIVFQNLGALDYKTRNDFVVHAIDMRDPTIDEMLRTTACVPIGGRTELQRIENLVHPEGKVACLYDQEDGRFPIGTPQDFLHPERLLRLEMLGMTKDRVTFSELMNRAWTVKEIWSHDRAKAYQRTRDILDLLKDQEQFNVDNQQKLQNIPLLPALLPHSQAKKGPGDNIVLVRAVDLYSCKYQPLVNMTEMILDRDLCKGAKLSAEAISFLGLNKQPPVETVLEQLKQTYRSDGLGVSDVKRIARECYGYLCKQLKTDLDCKDRVRLSAQEFPFVFVNGEFVSVKLVARRVSFDVGPYLYEVPKEYVECEELWKCLEIKERFGLQDYVSVLRRMSEKYGGSRLSEGDLAVCLRIVTAGFMEASEEEGTEALEVQNVLLPDQNLILRSAVTLQYNDTPWLIPGDDVNLCHQQIARDTAVRFKVQTTKHRALKNLQVSDLSLWAQEFGQQEKLTVRLKNIIKAYPSKKDILKELIQNADDAEASEIHFIWDPRKHGHTKTFGEEWNALQGPALCVYNNKKFTDKDIEGIQQLGEGGKGNNPEKTGKYGLGFNSVYHLTDCPSFISGDGMLCIFDPQLAVLSTAKPHSPGGMFVVNQKFKKTFEDVYTTFLPSFFNLELGTMFRLPLRTAEMAEKSDISKQAVTKEVILELLEVLKENSDSLLLFLNNIKKISFHKMDKKASEMQEIFTAEVKMSPESTREQEHLKQYIRKFTSSAALVTRIEPYQVIYEMEIRSSCKHRTKWILANKVGVPDSEVNESVQDLCCNLGQVLLPRSSVAACVNRDSFQGKAFCSLPLPIETGLPVHVNGNFAVDFARRDLWKQDGQSGKMKWNNFLKLYLIAPLYADLLDYIRATLSGGKAGVLKFNSMELCRSSLEPHYLWFFPHVSESVPQDWQIMISQVYKCMYQQNICLIPIVRHESVQFHHLGEKKIIHITWSSLTKEKRDEVPHFVTAHANSKLIEILEDIGMNLVLQSEYMTKIFKGLERAGMDALVLNPGTVRKFLQIHPLNNPDLTKSGIPLPLGQSLIKDGNRCMSLLDYCVSDVKEGNYSCINHLPLLVTQDNVLRKFQRASPKYISKFQELFPESQVCFANYDVNKKYKDLLTAAGFLEEFTVSRAEQFIRERLGYRFQINSTDPHLWLNWTENEMFFDWLKKLWKYFESQLRCNDDESENAFDKLKSLFSDLAILPVLCPSHDNQRLLAPLGSLNSVICEMAQNSLAQILLKLGFAKISSDYFSFKVMFNCIRPNSLRTDDKGSILEQLCVRQLSWHNLSEWEIETILRFLHSGMRSSDDKQRYQEQLKSLPLFETMKGDFENIHRFNGIYILTTQFGEIFPNLYELDHSSAFLKKTRINTELSEDIGIRVIDDLEFFLDYILPNVDRIADDQKSDVLRLLYNIICCYYPLYEVKREQITLSLKRVKLIEDKTGAFQQVDYFYENSEPLFKIMIPREKFVPPTFFKEMGCGPDDSYLNKLLKDLGIRCSVSPDDFIAFASQVSSEAKRATPLKELVEKSDVLISYLCDLDEDTLEKRFFDKLANVNFIYPHRIRESLRALHAPYAEGRNFLTLKDSLVKQCEEDEELVWTSMPILPPKFSQSKNKAGLMKAAGAVCVPPEDLVVSNLRKICLVPCQSQSATKTRTKVLQVTYGFLQSRAFDVRSLADLPLVLVEEDTRLVRSNQVVFSLQNYDEFRPYLYRLPPLLAPHRDFFQRLGVASEPSSSHLAQVLRALREDCKKTNSLNPNQMTTVKRALHHLFSLLESKAEERSLDKLSPLYLLGSDAGLYASESLCFNDRVTTDSRREVGVLKGKFTFLVDLGECHLSSDPYKQIHLLHLLPEEIRPKMLSQVTEELLNESVLQVCPYGLRCEFRAEFHGLLASPYFLDGLVGLIRSQYSGHPSEGDVVGRCQRTFANAHVVCCQKLETVLCSGSKPLRNTSIEKQVYTKASDAGHCVVYLEHRDDLQFSIRTVIIHSLATEINLLLSNSLSKDSLLLLVLMLSCEEPRDIKKILADKGIHTTGLKPQSPLDLPNPGDPIPEELIHTLEMDIMHNFKVGEYVGYKDAASNDYVYAVFVERLVGAELYVKGTKMQSYRIRIGPDCHLVVNNLDLYKFSQQKVLEGACEELVLVDKPQGPPSPAAPTGQKYESFDNIKREIHEYLMEIRLLPKDERQKAIRRLYLKWHPDKNPSNTEVATKLCHYIQEKVKELEVVRADSEGGSSHRKGGSSSCSSASEGGEDFSSFFTQWNTEASRHKRGRTQYRRSCPPDDFRFWSSSGRRPRADPGEAERWLRQAKCDLTAASNDLGCTDLGCTATEWFYFKVHQSVEKALIAAEYMRSGKPTCDHSISSLASQVSGFSPGLSDVESLVKRLKERGVDGKKTQYPSYHTQPHVPNDQFKAGNEEEVLSSAQTLLGKIEEYITNKS